MWQDVTGLLDRDSPNVNNVQLAMLNIPSKHPEKNDWQSGGKRYVSKCLLHMVLNVNVVEMLKCPS